MKKRYKALILILGIITLFFVFAAYSLFIYPPVEITGDKLLLGAHRGNSVGFIENTLDALNDAVQDEKYHFIEFDVQYTKDKVAVVHHDLSLFRLQRKYIFISELTYQELSEASDYHIPTYTEVMDLVAGKKPLNVEIKSQGNLEDDIYLVDFVIADLQKRGLINSTLISSISRELIDYVNNKYNQKGFYYWYPAYWNQTRYIDTGVIYYVKEQTFTKRIPLISDLTEVARDSGFFDSMISQMYVAGANHLMIHGANIHQYGYLRSDLPFNSRVVLWTFDDKMYLILPNETIWNSWEREKDFKIEQVKPWWEDN